LVGIQIAEILNNVNSILKYSIKCLKFINALLLKPAQSILSSEAVRRPAERVDWANIRRQTFYIANNAHFINQTHVNVTLFRFVKEILLVVVDFEGIEQFLIFFSKGDF